MTLFQTYLAYRKNRAKRRSNERKTWQMRIRDQIVPFLYDVMIPWSGHIIFASHARCKGCNAGLAYKVSSDIHGEWDCSNVIIGKASATEKNEDGSWKHPTFPFAFYEIKSENQPSAYGATTRTEGIPMSKWYLLWERINDWANKAEAKKHR